MARKTTTKKAEDTGEDTAEDKAALREDAKARIVELREEGERWDQIAAQMKMATGRCMYLYLEATVKPKDRIKAKTDEEMAEKIVAARDEDKLSWAQISTRSGVPESRCRKIYEDTTGSSTKGNRIGKGGRYPEGMAPDRAGEGAETAAKKAAAAKKASGTTKKAPAKKAPAKKAPASKNPLHAMDYEALADHLEGKVVTYKVGGKQRKSTVASVDDLVGEGADAEVTFTTDSDEEITVTLRSIVRAA